MRGDRRPHPSCASAALGLAVALALPLSARADDKPASPPPAKSFWAPVQPSLNALGIRVDPMKAIVAKKTRFLTEDVGREVGTPKLATTTHQSLSSISTSLQSRPFVNRPAQYSHAARNFLALGSFLQTYEKSGAKPSSAAYQSRAHAVLRNIGRVAKSELGVSGPHLVHVMHGGGAEGFNADTLANGAIEVNREVFDLADKIAPAIVASKDAKELVHNLGAVAAGTFQPPAGLDARAIQRQSDSIVGSVLAHEATHALRDHPALGRDPNGDDRFLRAKETIADAGSLELASRAGYGPKGLLAYHVYSAMSQALQVAADPTLTFSSDHPGPLSRYAFAYGYLKAHSAQPRRIYSSRGPSVAGMPLLSATQQAELAELPTPERLRELLGAAVVP